MARYSSVCLIVFALIISSCSGSNLRPDAVIPATQANYHTAEFTACGQRFNGIGICPLTAGQDLGSVALSIQGYYQGTIRVATTCGVDDPLPDSTRYTNSAAVPYYLSGQATASCLVSFDVSPEYPSEQSGTVVIHSMKGHLYIKVLQAGENWLQQADKAVAGLSPIQTFKIPAPGLSTVEVDFSNPGCNVNYQNKVVPVVSGVATVALKDLLPNLDINTCILSGVAFLADGPMRLTWFVDGYDTKFIPLPIPSLTQTSKKLTVTSDNNTSIVALDNYYFVSNHGTFNFNASTAHILRLLTTGGRVMIGQYDPTKGWSWIY